MLCFQDYCLMIWDGVCKKCRRRREMTVAFGMYRLHGFIDLVENMHMIFRKEQLLIY